MSRKVAVVARATVFTAPGVSHAPGAVVRLSAEDAASLIASGLAIAAPSQPKPAPAPAETVDGGPKQDGDDEDDAA